MLCRLNIHGLWSSFFFLFGAVFLFSAIWLVCGHYVMMMARARGNSAKGRGSDTVVLKHESARLVEDTVTPQTTTRGIRLVLNTGTETVLLFN